jgi:ribosomal protein S18 acetylase RimI-like enzyme
VLFARFCLPWYCQANVRVRPYRPNDFQFLARSCLSYAREAARLDPYLRPRPAPSFGAAYARSLLRQARKRRGFFLLAEAEGGRRAGFVVGLPAPLSSVERLVVIRRTRPCVVCELYVAPRFRRQGVGRRLLEEVERRFGRRGYDWIRLEVQPRNRFAVRLYRSMGYTDRAWILGRPTRT